MCSGFFRDSLENALLSTQKPLPDKGSPAVLPFGIIKKDEHAGAFIVLKTLIVMAVSIANQVIKDSRVNDVQEPGARVIRGRFLHSVAVALVILPPAGKQHHQGYLRRPTLSLTSSEHRADGAPA